MLAMHRLRAVNQIAERQSEQCLDLLDCPALVCARVVGGMMAPFVNGDRSIHGCLWTGERKTLNF